MKLYRSRPLASIDGTLFYFLVNVKNNDDSRSPLPILTPFQLRVIFASISNLPTSLPLRSRASIFWPIRSVVPIKTLRLLRNSVFETTSVSDSSNSLILILYLLYDIWARKSAICTRPAHEERCGYATSVVGEIAVALNMMLTKSEGIDRRGGQQQNSY
jgi:hypothetical protein